VIGLFDSGIGGLTVLKSLLNILPDEDYIYLGDTARLPYGTKSQETVKRYTEQNIHFLEKRGVDLVVSACHSASSSILMYGVSSTKPLFNVIEPACDEAREKSRTQNIGLLATATTVRAGQYNKLISAPFTLHTEPAPLLVPLVENNWIEDDITAQIVARYTEPLKKANVDAVILGCTHYPLLAETIQKSMGTSCALIDPGFSLAKIIDQSPARKKNGSKKVYIYLTDQSPFFTQLAQMILGEKNLNIEQVDL
jgi:glutamate racemase